MLTYLIKTTESLILVTVILGLILAYSRNYFEDKGKRVMLIGTVLGVISSIVMSYMKNATSRIDTSWWNLRIFGLALVAFVLFLVFTIKKVAEKTGKVGAWIQWLALAILDFTAILYTFPDVWAYPYGFLQTGQTIVSTDFLYKFIGYLFGLILMFVFGLAVYQSAKRTDDKALSLVLKIALLVNAIRQLSVGLQIMLARRMITSNHTLFTIAKYTSNYSNVFLYGEMVLALILPIVLLIAGMHVNEPYENPAQKRKIIAKWRNTRRWAITVFVTLLLAIMNMTVVKAYDNREVALSPVEDTVVKEGAVYVSFEQVEDGHLHRFAYESESGTQIRFIVIKKPNSSSYGIGLDACDICGETGYYEKDGQVVCKLCDVVMNVNTIGFKGGCNPIVIDYHIENGNIVVPIDTLLQYEVEFKR
ncbi:MAG: DUF2318 domain-containing protein [Lachnospiraceae bacterium]|nr:DUF2318 domain-containing protein [Lachnospiraceae bacterium]